MTEGCRQFQVTDSEVMGVLRDRYNLKVVKIERLIAFEDINYKITTATVENQPIQYVVKICHTDAKDYHVKVACLDFQRSVIGHLRQDGFVVGPVQASADGSYKVDLKKKQDEGNDSYILRVLEFVPGETLKGLLISAGSNTFQILQDIGEFVGKLHLSFQTFTQNCPSIPEKNPDDLWLLDNFSKMSTVVGCLEDRKKCYVKQVVEAYDDIVLPRIHLLQKGIIHGDLHDLNIIVNTADGQLNRVESSYQCEPEHCMPAQNLEQKNVKHFFGLIDFGDTVYSCYIFELAMVIRDLLTDIPQLGILEIGRYVLRGYTKIRKISKDQLDVLPVCIMAALCQYFVLGEIEFKKQPNNVYVKCGSDEAWQELQNLMNIQCESILLSWSKTLAEL